jgi:hypothetical protein
MKEPIDSTKPPIWFLEWNKTQFQPFVVEVRSRLDNLENRIDNLIKVNNLKE